MQSEAPISKNMFLVCILTSLIAISIIWWLYKSTSEDILIFCKNSSSILYLTKKYTAVLIDPGINKMTVNCLHAHLSLFKRNLDLVVVINQTKATNIGLTYLYNYYRVKKLYIKKTTLDNLPKDLKQIIRSNTDNISYSDALDLKFITNPPLIIIKLTQLNIVLMTTLKGINDINNRIFNNKEKSTIFYISSLGLYNKLFERIKILANKGCLVIKITPSDIKNSNIKQKTSNCKALNNIFFTNDEDLILKLN